MRLGSQKLNWLYHFTGVAFRQISLAEWYPRWHPIAHACGMHVEGMSGAGGFLFLGRDKLGGYACSFWFVIFGSGLGSRVR
jgi:hypothetical protein